MSDRAWLWMMMCAFWINMGAAALNLWLLAKFASPVNFIVAMCNIGAAWVLRKEIMKEPDDFDGRHASGGS